MYKNYKDEDLIQAYATMMATSGNITNDLKSVIESRGGIDYFKRIMELRKALPEEILRLQEEVQSLTNANSDYDSVRKEISSSFMSASDLDIFTKSAFAEYRASQIDKSITSSTIVNSFVGLIIGSIAGSLFWCGILYIFKEPFVFIMPVVFFIGYFSIKTISKQSFRNPVVLIASMLCFGISVLAGKTLFALLTN